jgi:23S rRNA (cytosine1962-C5)-methyltransferase
MMNACSRVILKPREDEEIRQGFPWVFDNEIAYVKNGSSTEQYAECTVPDGDVVEVLSKSGQYLGTGIINKKSKIVVRILSRVRGEVFDEAFFKSRIEDALAIRFAYYGKHDSYRLVFDEADFLPGLTVERYCDVEGRVFLVVQFLALCTEVFREPILKVLTDICRPFAIYERSDASVR